MSLDKIFLLNHNNKKFQPRLKMIENRLNEENLSFELVQKYSPEEIGYANYEDYTRNWKQFEDIDILIPDGEYRNFSAKISPSSLSLVLKHLYCFKEQVEKNYNNILILEDDCEIIPNFKEYLYGNFQDFLKLKNEDDVEMLMLGVSHDLVCKNKSNNNYAHYNINQKTRCTHAYITNINAAKKILRRFNNINLPIDLKLNEIMQIENIKVAWSDPGLKQISYS